MWLILQNLNFLFPFFCHIYRREEGEPNPFEDPVLKDIASETGKSIAQIILRFRLQNGICVIPKSITPGRLKENLDVSLSVVVDFPLIIASSYNAYSVSLITGLHSDLLILAVLA